MLARQRIVDRQSERQRERSQRIVERDELRSVRMPISYATGHRNCDGGARAATIRKRCRGIQMFPILAAMRQTVKLIYPNVRSADVRHCGCPAILQLRRHLRTNNADKGGTYDNCWASFSNGR
jgi:hypothetical protein